MPSPSPPRAELGFAVQEPGRDFLRISPSSDEITRKPPTPSDSAEHAPSESNPHMVFRQKQQAVTQHPLLLNVSRRADLGCAPSRPAVPRSPPASRCPPTRRSRRVPGRSPRGAAPARRRCASRGGPGDGGVGAGSGSAGGEVGGRGDGRGEGKMVSYRSR